MLVAVPGDQRDRPLRERAHRLAQVHVEAAQVLGELADLVHDRRHGQLHRLGQRKAAAVDQRLDQPVQVLRVGGVVADRRAQHQRLGPQPRDRVDLAVVAQHRERLHAHERRPRVRGVAVVAQQRGGLAARVGQVVEVALQHLRRAHHLVDAGVGGQGGHVRVELALDLDRDVEQHAVAASASGTSTPTCQKWGSSSRAVCPSAELSTRSSRSASTRRPARWNACRASRFTLLVVGRARDEDVRDREGRVERQPRRVAAAADLLLPQQARDVDHDAAAVALAVHVAGAVQHLLKGDEALLDHVMGGLAVAAHGRVQRAGVLVLDRLRAAARAVRLGGHVATGVRANGAARVLRAQLRRMSAQFILPGSAPSPSGRATGCVWGAPL